MNRSRLLVLTSTYPRHAGDTVPAFVHQLCRELSQTYEVHVLAPHDRGACFSEVMDGVHVHRFAYALPALEQLAYRGGVLEKQQRWRYLLVPGFLLMQGLAMAWLMCRYRFAGVHAHWLVPQGCVAALVTAVPGFRVPLMVTSHGGDLFALQGGLLSRLKRWVLHRAQAVTVVSEAMRERVLSQSVAASRVHVAPMGVDLQHRFVPAASVREGAVFVGRLAEKKGVDVLLQAMAILQQQGVTLPLLIVGDGAQAGSLREQARQLGLQGITWAGAVTPEAVPGYFQRAALAVVPSRVAADGDQEGLGLVCVEAMGCGCAVIASDLPAIRDAVEHGVSGWCVPPDDPAALAAALQQLAGDASERERLAVAGREAVCQRFDWPVAAGRYARLWQDLLS